MKVTEQVENILRVSSQARNSDRELIIIYMMKFGMNLTKEQIERFRKMPSMETIRRVRQALQSQGKYPASPEVEEKRYQKFKNVRENINYDSPEQLLESQGKIILPWGE